MLLPLTSVTSICTITLSWITLILFSTFRTFFFFFSLSYRCVTLLYEPLVCNALYISWSWNHQLVSGLHMLKCSNQQRKPATWQCFCVDTASWNYLNALGYFVNSTFMYIYTHFCDFNLFGILIKNWCTHIIHFIATRNHNEPEAFLHNFFITAAHKLCYLLHHGDIKQTAWDIQPGPVKHVLVVLLFSLISDVEQVL